jgi:hypothetical protein
MRYYAGITIPTEDDHLFGLAERHVWGLIFKAKHFLLLDHDAENYRSGEWKTEAEICFRQAREDDQNRPDEDRRMISQMEHGIRGFPETHPYAHLEYD